jgi:hypothetical protein
VSCYAARDAFIGDPALAEVRSIFFCPIGVLPSFAGAEHKDTVGIVDRCRVVSTLASKLFLGAIRSATVCLRITGITSREC